MVCTEIAKYLGGGAKYKQVWDRMNLYKQASQVLKDAVSNGQDPMTVDLDTIQVGKSKSSGNWRRLYVSFRYIDTTLPNYPLDSLTLERYKRFIWW